jgi:gamma-glutamylcyclotransferase (GGCT)/AIG2-like uncharacterized protein YtfP
VSRAKVFVYGTLKHEQPLHPLLRKSMSEFVGYDYIEDDWEFVDCGSFPAVHIGATGTNQRVYGELYKVSNEGLACLDMAEGHPDLFRRTKLKTAHRGLHAWVYILNSHYVRDKYVDISKSGVWSPSRQESAYWRSKGEKFPYAEEAGS